MATDFRYAEASNFRNYFPHLVSMSDNKNPVYNWVATGVTNQYEAHNTGLISVLFIDGEELGSAETNEGAVTETKEWFYNSASDKVTLFLSSAHPNDAVIESGSDYNTLMQTHLNNASMELNNMLDGRYSIPIQKSFIYAEGVGLGDTAEYDTIIIKMTCYLTAVNILRASGEYEQSDLIYDKVTNVDESGMVDKLNKGEWKLTFETDKTDSSGNIIEMTKAGTINLVETYGEWSGIRYDRIQLKCTTAGVYGVAKMSLKTFSGQELFGAVATEWVVTGGLTAVGNGLYVRFQGNSMAENDRWDIEVRNYSMKQSNSQGTRSIDCIRNDLRPARSFKGKSRNRGI